MRRRPKERSFMVRPPASPRRATRTVARPSPHARWVGPDCFPRTLGVLFITSDEALRYWPNTKPTNREKCQGAQIGRTNAALAGKVRQTFTVHLYFGTN